MLDLILSKNSLTAYAIIIGIVAYIPYFIGMAKGRTKPHFFSWLIWSILVLTAFAAQYSENGGPGIWVTGFTGVSCLVIALISLRYGEKTITRSDWAALAGALGALLLWTFTKNPLGSVLLISLIDGLALYPTFRKSWHKPYEEVLLTYVLSSIKFALSIFALDKINLVTVFYPASIFVLGIIFVIITAIRRKTLAKT